MDSEQRLRQASNNNPQIKQAIKFVKQAHAGQNRANGDPFTEHLFEVALILAEENLSQQTIVAGILHDTIEDTATEYQQLEEEFGKEIADMVAGLTKIESVTSKNYKAETYRRLLVAASEDARILIIKLADRLHNMRTISFLSPEKQHRISNETVDVYVPLAHRLGMSGLAHELEDRSLWVVKPEAYQEAELIRKEALRSGEEWLEAAKQEILKQLTAEDINVEEVKYRVKNVFSIAEKMTRGGSRQDIDDILGLRIIVASQQECYLALGVVHNTWTPLAGKIDDYIAQPRGNLYQSLHTTVNISGRIAEVQIRTPEMDEVAERGLAAHWLYKEQLREGGPQPIQSFIQSVASNQQQPLNLEDSFQALKDDFFKDEIYLFTPAGETKILPKGSCAIDFAYLIHSDVGNTITGARVDGKLTKITSKLKSGSVVEIITSNNSYPSLDWIDYVKTSKARQAIQKHHLAEVKDQAKTRALQELLTIVARQDSEMTIDKLLKALDERNIALGELPQKDLSSLGKSLLAQESKPLPRRKEISHQEVTIDGLDNLAVHYAGCCNPEQDDAIVGYLSKKGVTIHKASCSQLKNRSQDKILPADWNVIDEPYSQSFIVRFLDRSGLLDSINSAVYKSGSEFKGLELNSRDGVVRGRLTVIITSKAQVTALLINLKRISGALEISEVPS